jgi:hypothetical protein
MSIQWAKFDKKLLDGFEELLTKHFEEFDEALTMWSADKGGVGHALVAIDEALFGGSFAKEHLAEKEGYEEFRYEQDQWFEKGR